MDIRQGRARSRGFEISYELTGSGPTIVLVPGWLQDATDWRNAGSPSIPSGPYVRELASSYQVIAVDPLGHGRSEKPHAWESYRLPELAADIVAPLDSAGVARAIFWGYSRGAYLAAVAAAEFPDRVAALVIGGNPLTHDGWPWDWIQALASGDWTPFWALNPFPFAIDQTWAEDNDPIALAAQMEGENRSLAAQTDGETGPTARYRFDPTRITGPTLLYCGGNDSPENMTSTADRLGVELHIVQGLNHVQTFREANTAFRFVMPFLAAHASSGQPSRKI